jgi:hypothetical protein
VPNHHRLIQTNSTFCTNVIEQEIKSLCERAIEDCSKEGIEASNP